MPRTILGYLARQGKDWPDGELPEAGPCYLVADGLASKSRPTPGAKEGEYNYLPWLDFLRDKLGYPDFRKLARGFGYRGQGRHYERDDTYISLDIETSYSRTKEYVQRTGPSITYITFSLAGLIFTQGIASSLSRGVGYETVKQLILIQPAFGLHPDALPLAEEVRNRLVPVSEFLEINSSEEERKKKEASIIADLDRIVTANIPVSLIYWPDDKFVNYSEEFKSQLKGIRVPPIEVPITPGGRDPFVDHGNVSRYDKVCEMLAGLIS
jgi:hypothetical protein